MSSSPTLKSGHLLKLGGGNLRKAYQKRFFLLRGKQLYWFKKKGDVQHVGSIFVKSCLVTRYADKPKSFDIVTEGKTYSLKSKVKYIVAEWVEALAYVGAQVTTSYCSPKETSRALKRLTMSSLRPQAERNASADQIHRGRPQSNDKGRGEKEQWFRKHRRNRSVSDTQAALEQRMSQHLPEHNAECDDESELLDDGTFSSCDTNEQLSPPQSPVNIQETFVSTSIQTPTVTVMPSSPLPLQASDPNLPTFSFQAGYMANIPQGVAPVFSQAQSVTMGTRCPAVGMQVPVMHHASAPVLRCMGDASSIAQNQFLEQSELRLGCMK